MTANWPSGPGAVWENCWLWAFGGSPRVFALYLSRTLLSPLFVPSLLSPTSLLSVRFAVFILLAVSTCPLLRHCTSSPSTGGACCLHFVFIQSISLPGAGSPHHSLYIFAPLSFTFPLSLDVLRFNFPPVLLPLLLFYPISILSLSPSLLCTQALCYWSHFHSFISFFLLSSHVECIFLSEILFLFKRKRKSVNYGELPQGHWDTVLFMNCHTTFNGPHARTVWTNRFYMRSCVRVIWENSPYSPVFSYFQFPGPAVETCFKIPVNESAVSQI